MSVKLKEKDRGMKKIIQNFGASKENSHVKVGIQEGEGLHENIDGEDSGMTVAEIGSVHEFGAPDQGIPARSFIGDTIRKNMADIKAFSGKLYTKVVLGQMSIETALGLLGEKVQAEIITEMDAGIGPALDPRTVARKGSSKQLIDSGQLKQSIRYKVDA